MKIKYQEKDIFESETFISPGLGETIIFVGPENNSIKLILDFIIDSNEKDQKYVFVPIDNKSLRVKLINWNNVLGISFVEPIEIGTLYHRKLSIMLLVRKIGSEGQAREVSLTTYLGEEVKNGED